MDVISQRDIGDPLPKLEDLISGGRESGNFHIPYSPHQVEIIMQGSSYPFSELALHIDRGAIVTVVETVRNLVLEWALGLEQSGVKGYGLSFSSEEKVRAQESAINIGSFHGNLLSGDIAGSGATVGLGPVSSSGVNQTITGGEIFARLKQQAEKVEPLSDRELLRDLVDGMKAQVGRPDFASRYSAFIQVAANHMTLFAPLLPALSALLSS